MTSIYATSRAPIQASAAAAWALLADYANDPEWRVGVSRMDQASPGQVHDGARVVEELRLLGQDIRSHVEVSDVVVGSSFAWRVTGGATAHGTRRIVPTGERTCELVTEKNLVLSGAQRLLAPLIRWTVRRNEAADAVRAAELVERLSRSSD